MELDTQYQLESVAGIASRIHTLVPEEKGTLYVGLDAEKDGAMIIVSLNAGAPQVLGKDTRENILAVFAGLVRRVNFPVIAPAPCAIRWSAN